MTKEEWRAQIDERLTKRLADWDGPREGDTVPGYFQKYLVCWNDVACDLLAERLVDDNKRSGN